MSMPAHSLIRRLAVAFMDVLVSNRSMTGGGSKLGTSAHNDSTHISLCMKVLKGHRSLKSKTSAEVFIFQMQYCHHVVMYRMSTI